MLGDILAANLELWDTGQTPHYDVVYEAVHQLVSRRLVACPHRIIRYPSSGLGGIK